MTKKRRKTAIIFLILMIMYQKGLSPPECRRTTFPDVSFVLHPPLVHWTNFTGGISKLNIPNEYNIDPLY